MKISNKILHKSESLDFLPVKAMNLSWLIWPNVLMHKNCFMQCLGKIFQKKENYLQPHISDTKDNKNSSPLNFLDFRSIEPVSSDRLLSFGA